MALVLYAPSLALSQSMETVYNNDRCSFVY